ncbi:hypothetical protein [Nocardia yamanashiensis]|uniref:hypothetical protein n=1 Tax=Nocardia yamanashiensis TaxID=209247 RepID=UPI0012FDF343|nr:hypothetical protein [Nocardia yamanashiensis]
MIVSRDSVAPMRRYCSMATGFTASWTEIQPTSVRSVAMASIKPASIPGAVPKRLSSSWTATQAACLLPFENDFSRMTDWKTAAGDVGEAVSRDDRETMRSLSYPGHPSKRASDIENARVKRNAFQRNSTRSPPGHLTSDNVWLSEVRTPSFSIALFMFRFVCSVCMVT